MLHLHRSRSLFSTVLHTRDLFCYHNVSLWDFSLLWVCIFFFYQWNNFFFPFFLLLAVLKRLVLREDQVAIFADEYVSLFAGRSTLEYQDHYIRKTTPKFGRESRLKKKVVQVYFSFEKRFIFFSIFFLFSVSESDYLTGQTSQSIIMKHLNIS